MGRFIVGFAWVLALVACSTGSRGSVAPAGDAGAGDGGERAVAEGGSGAAAPIEAEAGAPAAMAGGGGLGGEGDGGERAVAGGGSGDLSASGSTGLVMTCDEIGRWADGLYLTAKECQSDEDCFYLRQSSSSDPNEPDPTGCTSRYDCLVRIPPLRGYECYASVSATRPDDELIESIHLLTRAAWENGCIVDTSCDPPPPTVPVCSAQGRCTGEAADQVSERFCQFPEERWSCKALERAYFFDQVSKTCQEYGVGTFDPFDDADCFSTVEACQAACQNTPRLPEVVTFEFSGVVEEVKAVVGSAEPTEELDVAVGDPVTGFYRFDPTVPNASPQPTRESYAIYWNYYDELALKVQVAEVTLMDRYSHSAVEVHDDDGPSPDVDPTDRYLLSLEDLRGLPPNWDWVGTLSMDLSTTTDLAAIDGIELPVVPPDPSLFMTHRLELVLSDSHDNVVTIGVDVESLVLAD